MKKVDAIFRGGAFCPLEPFTLPEGTRVELSVEETIDSGSVLSTAKIHSQKLAHPEDAAHFVMEVRAGPRV